jgi:intergrase/recombinase
LLKFNPNTPKESYIKNLKYQETSNNDNVINDILDKSEKSGNNYIYKERDLNNDNLYEFGSQMKDEEDLYDMPNFLREYKKQTKNVDYFYGNQLKLNEAKFEKILNDIQLKNKKSSVKIKYLRHFHKSKILIFFYRL